MLNEKTPFVLLPDNFAKVCCACYPGASIIAVFPELTGRVLSHGYCQRHADEFLASFKNLRKDYVRAGR